MNHVKKIGLLLTILMIEQIGFASSKKYSADPTSVTDIENWDSYEPTPSSKLFEKSAQQSPADQFIEESYVFPSQQVAICALFDKPFAINTLTGKPVLLGDDNQPRNWPTIEEIVTQANGNRRDGVFAAKQAIDIAIENARLAFALQADASSMRQVANSETMIMQDLAAKKQLIENALSTQRGNVEIRNFDDDDAIFNMENNLNNLTIYTTDHVKNKIMASGNDFKFLVNTGKSNDAANLLFKQCYIAQQGKNLTKRESLRSLLHNATDSNINNSKKIHQNLIAIARAVKTALYIAQNEYGRSWYNPTAYIPLYSSYTTHPLISNLQEMDEQVRKNLINPKFGATQADINRQYYLDWATSIAKGIVITGAVLGTVALGSYAYNNPNAIEHNYNKSKEWVGNLGTTAQNIVVNGTKVVTKQVTDGVSGAANIAVKATNTIGEAVLPKPTGLDALKLTKSDGFKKYNDAFEKEHSLAAQEENQNAGWGSSFSTPEPSALEQLSTQAHQFLNKYTPSADTVIP